MYLRFLLQAFSLLALSGIHAQTNYSPTYDELISEYRSLSKEFPGTCSLVSTGPTDKGVLLHAFLINSDGIFSRNSLNDNVVILIMNGIHPGEACGINASLDFAKEKVQNPDKNVTYCIIPVYNTGGMMNRGSFSRANQQGPDAYGFRGNARNLDLNRDFIKADSRNTRSFYRLFQEWKPHIFIDTHTSNGADYQPTLTLLSSFSENMESPLSSYLTNKLEPTLYKKMKSKGEEMVPYVNVFRSTPDSGFKAFTDYPRYSTGYASLFNVIGFTTEAHMLKPFADRVAATRKFLNAVGEFSNKHYMELIRVKEAADSLTRQRSTVPYNWKISEKVDSIEFPGYQANTETISVVTGLPTLRYNRNEPYRKHIPYYRFHEAQEKYNIPKYYLLSGAWREIIELLDLNEIHYEVLTRDTIIEISATYIDDYKSMMRPYEGHFKHFDIDSRKAVQNIEFYPGDIMIPTDQAAKKYLAHVFNPESSDSFFSWNFFDSCLMQKEYFSSYVFDETAAELLESDHELKRAFEEKKETDPEFAENSRKQLEFIYIRSPYYEKSHRRLPVFEID